MSLINVFGVYEAQMGASWCWKFGKNGRNFSGRGLIYGNFQVFNKGYVTKVIKLILVAELNFWVS